MEHNIGLLLSKRAQISANGEAFVEFERNRHFTFKELNQRCNRIANGLLSKESNPVIGSPPSPRIPHYNPTNLSYPMEPISAKLSRKTDWRWVVG